ncbi:MAG: PEGA domain-containing protein [Anaeromyxobacteraceae bacterium]
MIRLRPSAIVSLLLLACAALPARADEAAEAKIHYAEGTRLYRAQKYRAAIVEFENAYRKKPHGAIQYNLAQCHEKLGEWPAALRSYHDYLRELPGAGDRNTVLATIRRLEQKLADTGVQVLLVYTDPLGAEVRVDGKVRGATPFHVVLPPGDYAVTLTRTGYQTLTRDVVMGARGSQIVDEKLRPAEARPVPLPPPPVASAPQTTVPPPQATTAPAAKPDLTPAAPSSTGPGVVAKLPPPAPPGRSTFERKPFTWAAAGATAAALAGGIYFGMHAKSLSSELRDGTPRTNAASLASDAKSSSKRANILYGVAGLSAAAGATLFFVEGSF